MISDTQTHKLLNQAEMLKICVATTITFLLLNKMLSDIQTRFWKTDAQMHDIVIVAINTYCFNFLK